MTRSRAARVLHLVDGLAGGGSERWVLDIVRLSDPDQVSHRVVTYHPDLGGFVYADKLRELGAYEGAATAGRGLTPAPELVRRGPVRRGLRAAWNFPAAGYRAMSALRSFDPDVLHLHLTNSYVLGLAIAGLARRSIVHTVPCSTAQLLDAGLFWMPGLYGRSHHLVARFFTAYPAELLREGVPSRRVSEIRGVVDLGPIEAARAQRSVHRRSVRAAIGAPDGAPLALSVGRLHPQKGHDLGAKALAIASRRVADLHWVVLGAGEERAAIERLAADLGITERAHLLGFTADVLPYYAAADVYLRTNIFEAENLSSYQAMAMGLPVLGFDTGASTELLPTVGHGVLVPRGDAAAMGTELAALLASPERSKTFGDRGREHARTELDIRPTIAMFTETYERVAAERDQRRGA